MLKLPVRWTDRQGDVPGKPLSWHFTSLKFVTGVPMCSVALWWICSTPVPHQEQREPGEGAQPGLEHLTPTKPLPCSLPLTRNRSGTSVPAAFPCPPQGQGEAWRDVECYLLLRRTTASSTSHVIDDSGASPQRVQNLNCNMKYILPGNVPVTLRELQLN